jgi:dienelactone hydrolase
MKKVSPFVFTVLIFVFLNIAANAQKIKTRLVEYKDGDIVLEAYLAYDESKKGKMPAVLVVHEWMGLNDYAKKRCEQLAEMGYVAFAADVFGKGIRPQTREEAGKESGKYKSDRMLMRSRLNAAISSLKKQPNVDTGKIAAIGYCFGGMGVLELARSGADIAGVVSFHGTLDNPNPQDVKNIKCKVLVCHGAIDPAVPQEVLNAFMKEMNEAKLDYQLIAYSNAVHAFTNPASGNDNTKRAAYNELADRRSWEHMKLFFSELFK